MIKITSLIVEVKKGTMKLSRLITCMFREYMKNLYVKSCTHSHPSCPPILRLIPSSIYVTTLEIQVYGRI